MKGYTIKARIQVIIGLLTAIVCAVGILIISFDLPFFLIALIFPIAYGVNLIKKKLKTVKIIFFIWCGGWLLSCILFWLIDVLGVTGFCAFGILELIFILPIWIPVSPLFEYSLAVRVISGAIVMFLFWIGTRGVKQIIKAEQEKSEEIKLTDNC
ncbi:MAG: hypothetical protein OEW48_14390 [Phycisphaerae bacterium]|nr:hypothetical protein [Phycisphaerae bacterium]